MAGSTFIQEEMTIQGLPELLRKLDALPDALERKIGKAAMKEAAEAIRDEVIISAPVETGLLRDSLKIQPMRARKGRVGFMVDTEEGSYKGETFYAAFLEFGHHAKSRKSAGIKKGQIGGSTDARKYIPPKPFMRPAFDRTASVASQLAMDSIKEGIESIVSAADASAIESAARESRDDAMASRAASRAEKRTARRERIASRAASRESKMASRLERIVNRYLERKAKRRPR